jgi:hypothetical protein
LRQWAAIGSLLHESFSTNEKSSQPQTATVHVKNDLVFDVATGRFTTTYKKNPSPEIATNGISKSKLLHGIIDDSIAEATPSNEITFEVGVNGDIVIIDQDLINLSQPNGKDTAGDIKMEDSSAQEKLNTIAKSLDITGDLDIWISWLSDWAQTQTQ